MSAQSNHWASAHKLLKHVILACLQLSCPAAVQGGGGAFLPSSHSCASRSWVTSTHASRRAALLQYEMEEVPSAQTCAMGSWFTMSRVTSKCVTRSWVTSKCLRQSCAAAVQGGRGAAVHGGQPRAAVCGGGLRDHDCHLRRQVPLRPAAHVSRSPAAAWEPACGALYLGLSQG